MTADDPGGTTGTEATGDIPVVTAPPGGLRLRYAAVSDVGRHRKDNQDSGFASGRLLVVADGVGGQAFGDVASSTAVHLLRRLDRSEGGGEAAGSSEDTLTDVMGGPSPAATDAEESLSALAGAVHRVHDRLAEMVEQDSELDGTSTTLTAALFDGNALAFAHVGDSRAYLLRGEELTQLTRDHTFVQSLIDEGRITEAESRVHPHRNIILKAVDGVHDSDPDLFVVGVQPGDRVMLCSDGCSGVLDAGDIAGVLGQGSVDFAAVELVRASLDAGSTDNVTVVVAEVVDGTVADDPESAAAGVGPMLVGAAASQPRRGMLSRIPFGRRHDTGELDPVTEEVDPEELRYAPRDPHRGRGLRWALMGLVPLLLLVAAAVVGYSWSQQQYYVAADGPQVAVYKGVQMDLPGVQLSEVHETSPLQLSALPDYNRQLVEEGIVADSLDDAHAIVDNLEEDAREKARQECPAGEPTRDPKQSPDRSPDQSPDQSPGLSPDQSPSGDRSPSSPRSDGGDAGAGTAADCPSPTRTPSQSPGQEPTSSATGSGSGGR